MISWLKRLLSEAKERKKLAKEITPYYPTEHADTRNYMPLDPKNDPWGRS